MKTMNGSIKKAVIELLILKLLSESDMYGYQITQELKKRSGGKFTVLEGSMYPILYRLADDGYISFYEEKISIRQTRVYYHLEELGQEKYAAMQAEYRQAIQMVEFLLESTMDSESNG
ncbi:PadR family transcriptional regulator [Lachnospiraceae bacterium ZAX-1]